MIIIGCDYHPGFQQIAYVNTHTGELSEARLDTRNRPSSFTTTSARAAGQCGWAWKPVGMRAGLSAC